MAPLVIVFAKAPRPGFVKTRLGLDPAAAASLHAAFVKRTVETVYRLRDEADIELSTDLPCDDWTEFPVARTVQCAGGLGDRLYAALERSLHQGRTKVAILGSDSPTLPMDYVRALLNSDTDVTLGPTVDGGYYGIACRRIGRGMFDGVRWSSQHALEDTIRAVEACGLRVALGPRWFDIDTPQDLERLT